MKFAVISIILLAALAITVLLVRNLGEDYAAFVKNAYKGSAFIVTKKEVVIDPKNQRKELQVEYRYLAGGTTIARTEKLEYEDMWNKLMPGQQVDIYISNSQPTESYLAAPMDRRIKLAGKEKR